MASVDALISLQEIDDPTWERGVAHKQSTNELLWRLPRADSRCVHRFFSCASSALNAARRSNYTARNIINSMLCSHFSTCFPIDILWNSTHDSAEPFSLLPSPPGASPPPSWSAVIFLCVLSCSVSNCRHKKNDSRQCPMCLLQAQKKKSRSCRAPSVKQDARSKNFSWSRSNASFEPKE